ncbi:MAG TPA: succinylglutamate desuccinylase/aspartoacylase family protein [bacterium]|nr:succinylglutamate desuccinylase/aspartoacylase family protein [bacterium]
MVTRLTEWVDVERLPLASRHSFDLAVVPLADGSWLTVPVKVVIGSRPRPRLVAIAGVHGDEPEGMLALLDFAEQCDPVTLRGAVVLVPVANPPAFAAHQRRSPVDGLDLNRTFPGRPDGTPSERLAYRLVNDVLTGADLVFTLHSWYATGMVVPHVEVPDGGDAVSRRSWEAAVAAGFTRIRGGGWQPGVLGVTAADRGVPVLEAEIGGQGMSTSENRAAYVDHLTRLLRHLGILDGDASPNPEVEVLGRGLLHAPAGGMLRLNVRLGEYVEAGTILASITNLHGERLAEIQAPHAGLVAAIRQFISVNPGDLVFALYPRR